MSTFRPVRKVYESVSLQASAVQTATGQSAAAKLPYEFKAVTFELDLTAAATVVGDTLDVTIQTKVDQSNWIDACHFTQAVGNGGAKRYLATLTTGINQTMYEVGTALTAGSVRNVWGDEWRVSWVIAGTSPSFTFSVWACTQ